MVALKLNPVLFWILILSVSFFWSAPLAGATGLSALDAPQPGAPTPGATLTMQPIQIPDEQTTITALSLPSLSAAHTFGLLSPAASASSSDSEPDSRATLSQTQLLSNSGFDAGQWAPWQTAGQPELTTSQRYSAPYAARMAGYNGAQDLIAQRVTVPANATELVLEFLVRINSQEIYWQHDWVGFDIRDADFGATLIDSPRFYDIYAQPKNQWLKAREVFSGAQLSPLLGRSIGVSLFAICDGLNISTVWIDDVTMTVTTGGGASQTRHVYLPLVTRIEPPSPPPTETTYYYGTATMDVWYKASPWSSAQRKTYRQSVKVEVGPPRTGEDGTVEHNPLYYFAHTPQAAGKPGHCQIESATRYPSTYGYYSVFQYWWYTQKGGSYQGSYQPPTTDDFNIVITEDLSHYLPFCTSAIKPGATINISFGANRLTTKVAGTVRDTIVPQLCTSYIDRFEILIEATR